MGKLTTHVLDTANGVPAAGLRVTLSRLEGDVTTALLTRSTNTDGRCDQPLLEGSNFLPGRYELSFQVAEYFSSHTTTAGSTDAQPFLDDVVIRFGIADADQHYHVPLLVSPFGYTTYRGS